MDSTRRTHGIRDLARPVAVGLLVLACVVPTSFNVHPAVATPRDEFVTRSLATQAQIVPAVPAHDRAAIAELFEPSPSRERPVVLAIAGRPHPLPFVSPPPVDTIRMPTGSPDAAQPSGVYVGAPASSVAEGTLPALAVAKASLPLALVTPPATPSPAEQTPEPLRAVDIAQIDASRAEVVRVPQLHEPGLVPGGPNLAEKTAAMQVTLPPPARLSQQELALLQTDAPSKMTVRLGEQAVGQVAFRMSENRTIDVQLSGILDVLSDRFAPEDFARLRGAAAADSYVPLDTLRSVGLGLRYDPVYDELRVSA